MGYYSLEEIRKVEVVKYKRYNRTAIIFVVIFLCSFVSFGVIGFYKANNEDAFTAPFIIAATFSFMCGAILAGIFGSKAAKVAKKYSEECKSQLMTNILDEIYDEATYDPKGMLEKEDIRATGLIRGSYDRVSMEDLIVGKIRGVGVKSCDLHIEERHESRDSDGHTSSYYVTLFLGRWYEFEFSKPISSTIRVVPRFHTAAKVAELQGIETESVEFNKMYNAYATDQQEFFKIFSPAFITKLIDYCNNKNEKLYFEINNNKLTVGIYDKKDHFEISIKKPLDNEMINDLKGQVEVASNLIDFFNLDTKYSE